MDANQQAASARREVNRTILSALWRYRGRTAAAVALLVTAKLLMVAVPAVLKRIVDLLSAPGMLALPVFLLLGYALLRFAGSLFTELRDLIFVRVTQATVADFTLRMFAHLQSLGARFHAARQTGALARDVERGTTGVGFLLGTALFTLLPTLVEIISVVVILTAGYSLWFAFIVAVTFFAYAVYTVLLTERRTVLQRALNELDSRASARLVDSLLNYEAVKQYANEALENERLGQVMHRWVGVGVDNQRSLSRLHIGQAGIIACGVAAVMLLAGQQVTSRAMTVGDLVLVNAYIIQICLPLSTLGLIFRQAKEAFINAERICGLLLLRPEVADSRDMPPLRVAGGEVRFERIDFGYEPGRRILWDVDFTIPAGATVAVVGGSGSGKSTLARLLFRFYDPDSGRVLFDGQDLRTVEQGSLRRSLGIVPQDTLLFNDTIAYNIGYSMPQASREQIVQAARGARVHEFIESLPAGYDTMVGERGVKLSGGERQRIAIARALLKNPPVLVFDEATSALDTRTERAIQAELERISRGRTTLVIAHRLSTIVNADRILVLDHGRIVESGEHQALLAADGLYAQMWRLQRQQHELEQAGERASRQPVNLVTLVAAVLDGARELIDAKGVNLYTLIGADAGRITGDPGEVQQLIWDLTLHAVAVTPPGGRLELRLERDGPVARLVVTDGRAAPADSQAQLPGDDAPPALRAAAALDPARAAATAQRLGGVLRSAPAAGGGISCTLEFAVRALDDAAGQARDVSVDLTGVAIVLVDDQREARELVGEALRDHGARIEAFGGGSQALQALGERPASAWPDLIICDISLGDIDGYELLGRVRAMEAERQTSLETRVPAIALSGHADAQARLRALLAGYQVHLAKPVDPRELVAAAGSLARGPGRRSSTGSST
ncbi:ATP-binding cassette domain-containing protein [Bordetella bronchiseptica]|uniref:ATP-binding cassette domain-containing protein n=1 Tax=Bordetella bronchiseptica TaxID=518 RepID=UPI00081C71A9|nr:ATP-binding cassette domain-containing protein [Bordetella bronchiseptica]AOB26805.1 ABC transporter ATP-binding protein [Bordetella bronchiseptica]AZW44117.1 ABC transporter ATP-binding protein [Bordetella bronchiseptica]